MAISQATKYSPAAMALHWLIFAGVIANWRIAEAAEHAEEKGVNSAAAEADPQPQTGEGRSDVSPE